MDFSFVIRTYNEGKFLDKTLELINKLEGNFSKEVIIVDSESTDNTLEIAEKYNCKIIIVKRSEWTWGKALNIGIENAKGKFIVILSGHSFIKNSDFLLQAKNFLQEENKIAAVYGKQFPIDEINPFEEFEYRNYYPDIEKFLMTNPKKKLIGISNACSIIKKEIWEEVKYDEKAQSLEDSIWAKEVLSKGYKLIYSNKLSIYHSHIFDISYLYKRYYWFIYYNLMENLNSKYLSNKKRIKNILKKFSYKYYLFFNKIYTKRAMIKFFQKKQYNIEEKLIDCYLYIKYTATYNAFKDFFIYKDKHPKTYLTLDVPDDIKEIENLVKPLNVNSNKDFDSKKIQEL